VRLRLPRQPQRAHTTAIFSVCGFIILVPVMRSRLNRLFDVARHGARIHITFELRGDSDK
jgi:hypothetical protein